MLFHTIILATTSPLIRSALLDLLESLCPGVEVVSPGREKGEEALLAECTGAEILFLDPQFFDAETTLRLVEKISACPMAPSIIILSAAPAIDDAICYISAGASDYFTPPWADARLQEALHRAAARRGKREALGQTFNHTLQDAPPPHLLGTSAPMLRLRELIRKTAPTDASVLISGAHGTGKELVATELQRLSPRVLFPFVKVNCAGLSPGSIESELFGLEKGVGGHHPGCFERAHQGTLLLDEIGEIPLSLQGTLLRVLEEREFKRGGGAEVYRVDTRIIATTTHDLWAEVAQGNFREDLFYRLHVIPLHIPPLAERREDILPLAKEFLREASLRYDHAPTDLSPDHWQALEAHSWPGNVRELRNYIDRIALLGFDTAHPLPPPLARPQAPESIPPSPMEVNARGPFLTLKDLERQHILSALTMTNGNRTQAAHLLQVSIRTLRNKLNDYKAHGLIHLEGRP